MTFSRRLNLLHFIYLYFNQFVKMSEQKELKSKFRVKLYKIAKFFERSILCSQGELEYEVHGHECAKCGELICRVLFVAKTI